LRGIPKEAVRKNLPIAESSFRAADAANMSDTCPWNLAHPQFVNEMHDFEVAPVSS
jgi:hypothetical protein